MAERVLEYDVLAPELVVDPATGSATIAAVTTKGVIHLNLGADVLLLLRDRIAQKLAEARDGGFYMLPAVEGCHGLEAGSVRSQLRIRLVLEGGLEGRLPIQESALSRLNTVLTGWFAEQEDQGKDDYQVDKPG